MENLPKYKFHDKFILRFPLVSFKKDRINENLFFHFSQQMFFKESIYIASPVLYDELVKWHNGKIKERKKINKLLISLFKYYTRMQSRCTPYGLFAGCATGIWGDKNEIIISDSTKRHTRLDMDYLCVLAQKLNSHSILLPVLKFYPNNSIYVIANTLRYVEFKYIGKKRAHQICSVDYSIYLKKILDSAKTGTSIQKLVNIIVNDNITYQEAEAFIKEIIDSQILISEIDPAITGDEFIYQLIITLKKLNTQKSNEINHLLQILDDVHQQILIIDQKIVNDVKDYRIIYDQLKSLNIPIEENQLFQTDLYKNTITETLNKNIKEELLNTVKFLNKIDLPNKNSNLKKFKNNFYSQYEDAELPLLEVLDTETGIGYKYKDISGVNELLDDVYISPKTQQSYNLTWNKQEELLHERLLTAIKKNEYTVTFTDSDIKSFNNSSDFLPDSLAVMFRIIDKNKIYFQNCGGSSATNLLGRFAHGDNIIHDIIKDIVAHEKKLNPDKILAEIVHLPESRIGNILLRPVLREYEIPYLGKSSLPEENQILLQDLMVSIKNNKIILRSKKLNKEIIPRLSTAHNYSFNALPVYQFLCDMQTQYFEKSGLGFSWGQLSSSYKFLPRAEYNNVILERAKWQLPKPDFEVLLNSEKVDYSDEITNWRKQWNIPQYVVLVDGDNELLINFDDPLSIKMLVSSIKKRDQIVLEEFLFDVDNLLVKDDKGNGYTNEFIAILLKNESTIKPVITNFPLKNTNNLRRNFCIGSEWLYYKFYCGVKTADKILIEVIKPLIEELLEKRLIDKFFFIRYSDPDLHIRLRFHVKKIESIGEIITLLHQFVQTYLDHGLINKIQTDTYKRELERYGNNSMELSESFFYVDSITALNLFELIDEELIRWQFAIRSIDELLKSFHYSFNQKLMLVEHLKDNFIKEHSESKELKLQLDSKFRNSRKQIEDILNLELDSTREPLIKLLEWKREQIQPLADKIIELQSNNELEVELNDLLASYLHMMFNRIFKSRQRTYEMVIYDFLYRYYKSKFAREKSRKKMTIVTNTLSGIN